MLAVRRFGEVGRVSVFVEQFAGSLHSVCIFFIAFFRILPAPNNLNGAQLLKVTLPMKITKTQIVIILLVIAALSKSSNMSLGTRLRF